MSITCPICKRDLPGDQAGELDCPWCVPPGAAQEAIVPAAQFTATKLSDAIQESSSPFADMQVAEACQSKLRGVPESNQATAFVNAMLLLFLGMPISITCMLGMMEVFVNTRDWIFSFFVFFLLMFVGGAPIAIFLRRMVTGYPQCSPWERTFRFVILGLLTWLAGCLLIHWIGIFRGDNIRTFGPPKTPEELAWERVREFLAPMIVSLPGTLPAFLYWAWACYSERGGGASSPSSPS